MKRLLPIWSVAAGFLLSSALAWGAGAAHEHPPAPREAGSHAAQRYCPVMTGNEIDPDIFTVYRGKKVYFCCQECKRRFEAEPEKYLARLPQFAGGEDSHADAGGHAGGIALGWLVKPLGIATLVLLLLTASAGLFRRKNPGLLLKWHKRLALATVLAALCHATLVLLFH